MRTSSCKLAFIATAAIALLTNCAGGSSTPATRVASPQAFYTGSRTTSSCPCLYVANYITQTVTVYPSGATNNAKPIQTITGTLKQPLAVTVDAGANIYVANYNGGTGKGSVTVYPAGATGNVAPIQVIEG